MDENKSTIKEFIHNEQYCEAIKFCVDIVVKRKSIEEYMHTRNILWYLLERCSKLDDGIIKRVIKFLKDENKITSNPTRSEYIGECYNTMKKYKLAMKWFQKNIDEGYSNGYVAIGHLYFYGHGIKKDFKESLKYFQLAAIKHNPHTYNEIGYSYEHGCGVERDSKKAMEFYRLAANQKDSCGLFNLADMYENGIEVTRNYKEALKFYRMSADLDDRDAQYKIGEFYYYGHGVSKDIKEALKWYQLSASWDCPKAQEQIGDFYRDGICVEKNFDTALKYYIAAGNRRRIENLLHKQPLRITELLINNSNKIDTLKQKLRRSEQQNNELTIELTYRPDILAPGYNSAKDHFIGTSNTMNSH